jgi:hypothetical protein
VKTIEVPSIKAVIPFKAGSLPRIDPNDPAFELTMSGLKIRAKINAKAARRLAGHTGSAILQGRLVMEGGRLLLVDAGFTFNDPKPVLDEALAAGQSVERATQ